MFVTLPRGVSIDIDNVPENLEEIVQNTFAEYTEGTHKDYRDQDRLLFLDVFINKLHHVDADDDVNTLIKSQFTYELENNGEIVGEDYFLTREFMEDCYNAGNRAAKMYSYDFAKQRDDNEKIMRILVRVIRAVMAYPED